MNKFRNFINLYRLISLAFIIVFFTIAVNLYLNNRDYKGDSAIWKYRIAISPAFMIKTKANVNEMVEYTLNQHLDTVRHYYSNERKFIFNLKHISEKKTTSYIDYNQNSFDLYICFYYEENGNLKTIIDYDANGAFFYTLSRGGVADPNEEKNINIKANDFFFTGSLKTKYDALNQQIVKSREIVKNWQTPDYNVYSNDEILTLKSYHWVCLILNNSLISLTNQNRATGEYDYYVEQGNQMVFNFMVPYTEYYIKNFLIASIIDHYNFVIKIILSITLAIIFLFHFFRQNLYVLLKTKLDQNGIKISKFQYWQILLSNWKIVLMPIKDFKLEKVIRPIIQKEKNKREKKAIRNQAKMIWKELKKSSINIDTLQSLQHNFDLATGKNNKPVLTRRQNLLTLNRYLYKIKKEDTIPQGKFLHADKKVKKKKTGNFVGSKNAHVEGVSFILNGYDHSIKAEELSRSQLLNLETCLICLRQTNIKAFKAFILNPKYQNLIKDNASLYTAVTTGNKKAVVKILGLEKKEKIQTGEGKRNKVANPLDGKKAALIGAKKIGPNQRDFCDLVLSLGAQKCDFYDTSKQRRIDSLSKSLHDVIIVFTNDTAHEVWGKIKKRKGSELVEINTTNISSFEAELRSRLI